ncbi:peptide ABC transporter substrate-binding protein [Nesterenkonia alba]|uniref:peptide ABC transporter substrate-binding protein n=1 Tax=Nesterenkonia alba TaxID=515814 RepID=UPI0003B73FCA|nr:ABC transporter substrate-binding protein [Nesterenkonia alba]
MNNRTSIRTASLAVAASAALVLSACGGNGDDDENGNGNGDNGNGEAAETGGTLSIANTEPQNFMPGNSSEVGGSKMLEQLFTGLTGVDYETYEVVPGVAESWEANDDATVWTFELRDDWTFHNGDEITAQTFVDTFNWVVDPENGQQNADFYDVFLGYEDVVEGNADELEGVTAVDDYTLEIELNEPFSPLPMMLSYTGFYPVPQEAFDDPDAFEQSPIGNGEYQMDGEWEHDVQVAMDRWEDWPGESQGGPDRIEWRLYADMETAYLDVQAGELDLLDTVPAPQYGDYEASFPENHAIFETSSFEYLGFPLYQEEFEDPDIRQALSMAIDREQIIESIYHGLRTPATGPIPPMLAEYREDKCDACEYDPDTAAELYEAAGGPSELTIYFNSGAGHEEWVESISNMWQEHLPIDDIEFQSLEFAQYLDLHDDEQIDGPFRLGWSTSYPNAQYTMEPIYTTGVSSNYTHFNNEEFDDLIAQANAETDEDAATELYQQAEDLLLEEMPIIPLWYGQSVMVHTDAIDNDSLLMDYRGFTRVEQVTVLED